MNKAGWVGRLGFQLRLKSFKPITRIRPNNYAKFYFQSNRSLTTKTTLHKQQNNSSRSRSLIIGLSTVGVLGIITVTTVPKTTLYNEPRLAKSLFKDPSVLSNTNKLEPDFNNDLTFEANLFNESLRELEDESEAIKKKNKSKKYLIGYLYTIRYFLVDYLIEPLVTVGRFLELAGIFTPILIAFPIIYFGKRDRNGDTYGSLLWFKLIRQCAELAGASFIKLGQWAASRTDIFPVGLCHELSELHSNAKTHSLRQTEKILGRTFGGHTIDEIFDEFDPVPIGTGAIAQVYFGKLKSQFVGENQVHDSYVAIKVVHPNIEIKIERDLKIMKFFANFIDVLPTMEWLSLPQEVEQFSILMKLQLDLRIEGYNLLKFREKFANDENVKFPKPFLDISSRKVLIEERIVGLPMNKILLAKENFGKGLFKEISDHLIDSFLKMLILDNFIHADLHPGNILVRFIKKEVNTNKPLTNDFDNDSLVERLRRITDSKELLNEFEAMFKDGYHPQICFIDAGLITELDETNRFNFISLFNALSEFDGYKAGELMIDKSKTPWSAIDTELFKMKVEKLVNRVKKRTFSLGTISIGDLLDQMLGIVRTHHVRMEADFISVIVAILLLEGLGRQLDPELDLFARSVPILRKLSFKDGKLILQNSNALSMLRVWLTLEARQFVNASIHDVSQVGWALSKLLGSFTLSEASI